MQQVMHIIYAYDCIIAYLHISTSEWISWRSLLFWQPPRHVHFQPIQNCSHRGTCDETPMKFSFSGVSRAWHAGIVVLYARVFHPNGSKSFPQGMTKAFRRLFPARERPLQFLDLWDQSTENSVLTTIWSNQILEPNLTTSNKKRGSNTLNK